jgi:hypothetical protein
MPGRVALGDRAVLAVIGGVSLLLLVIAIVVTGRRAADPETPTSYSAASEGAKAFFLMLEAAHYPVERWERNPTELPADPHAVLVLAEPEAAPTDDERAAVERFLRGGGRLIATGAKGADFLPRQRVVPDPIAGLTWRREPSTSPSTLAEATPAITLAPRAFWAKDPAATPLYGDAGRARVVSLHVGAGEAFWWASATPLTNAGAREPGNVQFVLASFGGRRILWDEYFHGHRPRTAALRVDPQWQWAAGHLVLLAAAALLTFSRRSGPIVAPQTDRRLSPLEFVRALGSLYERAGAASTAVDAAYERFRFDAARRFGTPVGASTDDFVAAWGNRRNVDTTRLRDLLRECEAARRDRALRPATALRLIRSLNDYSEALRFNHGAPEPRETT